MALSSSDFWKFIQPIIFYSSVLLMGVADGLWKKSVCNGVITTILGVVAAYIILNPASNVMDTTQIEKYHITSTSYTLGFFYFVRILIIYKFITYFFNSQELGQGRPGSRIYLLLLFSLFCAFFEIVLNSFWLVIGTIWAAMAATGDIIKLQEPRKKIIIEKVKVVLKQKDELLREKECTMVFNFELLLERINEGAYSKSDPLIAFRTDENSFIELFSLEKALSLLVNTTIQAGEAGDFCKSLLQCLPQNVIDKHFLFILDCAQCRKDSLHNANNLMVYRYYSEYVKIYDGYNIQHSSGISSMYRLLAHRISTSCLDKHVSFLILHGLCEKSLLCKELLVKVSDEALRNNLDMLQVYREIRLGRELILRVSDNVPGKNKEEEIKSLIKW